MLDRSKLACELAQLSEKLFIDCSQEYKIAHTVWQKIVADPTFIFKVRNVSAPWPVPTWTGRLDEANKVAYPLKSYHILAVDGSQIYPDRHQGVLCFLINIGSIALHYGTAKSRVLLYSNPYVFSGNEDKQVFDVSPDFVNARRQELELQAGLKMSIELKKNLKDNAPFLLLYDGSLIFWHLESKDIQWRDTFLSQYLAVLHHLYQEDILVASYISLSKSKELVSLIRLFLCSFDTDRQNLYSVVDHVSDTHIAQLFLQQFERSIVFQNNSHVSQSYPSSLRPHFFYLHIGSEIGRVEIPAWIAQDEEKVNTIAQIILDQCIKGRGYPVTLAEAHEQAVVKGPDRDFFYHLLSKISLEKKHRLSNSQKSIKKRGIGI